MNKEMISLLGRIAVKPELMESKDKKKYLKIRLAVNKDKTENDKVTYYDVLVFGKRIDKFSKLPKGKLIYTSGRIDIKPYISKQGLPKVSLKLLANDFYILDTKIFK